MLISWCILLAKAGASRPIRAEGAVARTLVLLVL